MASKSRDRKCTTQAPEDSTQAPPESSTLGTPLAPFSVANFSTSPPKDSNSADVFLG